MVDSIIDSDIIIKAFSFNYNYMYNQLIFTFMDKVNIIINDMTLNTSFDNYIKLKIILFFIYLIQTSFSQHSN